MLVENLQMSEAEKQLRIMEKQTFQHETGIEFLKAHKGWRNGNIHMYMGTSGSGKSTSLRTFIKDYIEHNPMNKLGVWLSEETIDDLKDEYSKIDDPENIARMASVIATSEMQGMNRGSLSELKKRFREFVLDHQLEILFLDNITTSAMYNTQHVNVQEEMQGWFKSICLEANIPFVFFCHTDGKITDNINRLIDMNDIRGSKGITNLAQYFYITQRFELGNHYYPTLRIRKYRGHDVQDRMYYLHYDKVSSTYIKSWPLPWEEFQEAFKKRNKLM